MLAQVVAPVVYLRIMLGIGHQQSGEFHRGITTFTGIGLYFCRRGGIQNGPAVLGAIGSKSVGQGGFMRGRADRITKHDGAPSHDQKTDQAINIRSPENAVRGI